MTNLTDFIEHRKDIKKPMSERAISMLERKLARLEQEGHSIDLLIENAIIGGWQTVYEGEHTRKRDNVEPKMIHRNWEPNPEVYQILFNNDDISVDFVEKQIPEFILYWLNARIMHTSWDNKFIDHVRFKQKIFKNPTGKEEMGFLERHADTSWADNVKRIK
jgi:hypothetical protein